MSLPPEKRAELRQVIHDQLNNVDIHRKIKDSMFKNEILKDQTNKDQLNEDEIMSELKSRGIIDDLLNKLSIESPMYLEPTKRATNIVDEEKLIQAEIVEKVAVDPTRRYLYMQLLGGRAFIEHLHAFQPNHHDNGVFVVNVHFRGQRFRSKPVPVAVEPNIRDGFLFELKNNEHGDNGSMMSKEKLLSTSDVIHIVLTKHDGDDVVLVSSHALEWRNCLACEQVAMTTRIELMGVGSECKIPAGVLDVRLEVVPRSEQIRSPHEVVRAQVHLEKQRRAEKDRLFVVYARQWWQEYLQIRDCHRNRSVKIFAQDETGVNRCVCSYIHPLKSGRLITSPKMAIRFVSAFPYEKHGILGGVNRGEQWLSIHSFLCVKKGDHQDHSNLLCSLLLAFGLDAYVCVGSKKNGASYTWVMIKYSDGSVYFVDPVAGVRYSHNTVKPNDPPSTKQPLNKYNFKAIGCVYNNSCFYANCQPLDTVETCMFDFTSQSLWKRMTSTSVTASINPPNICHPPPPLTTPTLDPVLLSNQVETELIRLITRHRKDTLGLTTLWDDQLSFILSPALWSYELERCSSAANVGNKDFQEAVKRNVEEGFTFKGFPTQFPHRDPNKMMAFCLKNSVCCDVIEARGDVVSLAVRAQSYVFPDDVTVTWVMIACKYRCVL